MTDGFGHQSLAVYLNLISFFFVLLFLGFFGFFTFTCIVLPYVTNWYHFAKYKKQKYFSQNTVISHIGKTFYCSVLPTFSIKFFFRVDFKHFASHMV